MFKLVPNPTFPCEARLTIPGAEATGVLTLEFRHQGRAALRKWIDSFATPTPSVSPPPTAPSPLAAEIDALHAVIEAWSGVVDDDGHPVNYSRGALGDLLDAYPAAGGELFKAYLDALTESRLGN